MKKRVFILILAVLLLGSLIPLAAAKGGENLFEDQYDLTVGREGTRWVNNVEVTGIYPQSVSEGILPGDNTTRTYRFYVELYDYENDIEAPKESYERFWAAYDVIAYLRVETNGTRVETPLELKTDGYRKYAECSFKGAYSGDIRVEAYEKSASADTDPEMIYSSGQRIRILEATKLTKNAAGEYSFSLTNPDRGEDYFYYIDLGKTEVYGVSGSLADKAAGSLEIPGECTLYWKDDKGGNTNDYTGSGRIIMLQVSSRKNLTAAETYTLTGTVRVEIEQPAIWVRYLDWDNQNKCYYINNKSPLRSLSDLNLPVNNTNPVVFYYGTSLDYAPASKAEITKGDAVSLEADTDRDGNLFWHISGDKLGTSELTITVGTETYPANVTVGLPSNSFYSAQVRDGAHYLQQIDRTKLTDDTVWLIGENGYTAADLDKMSVLVGDKAVDSSNLIRVPHAGTADRYDLKIVLPAARSFTEEYSLKVTQDMGSYTYYVANAWVFFGAEATSAVVDGYTVGFAWYDEDSEITMINGENWRCGNGTSADESETYVPMRTVQIAAGIRKLDEEGHAYYEIDKQDKVALQIKKVWVEPVFGYEDLFSLSETAHLGEKTGYTDLDIDIYNRDGCPGAAMVWAEVDVTVKNGQTQTVQVSTLFFISKATIVDLIRPMDDTVEKLNDDLQELAKDLVPGGIYTVYLAPIVYEGVIKIPSVFNCGPDEQDLTLQGDLEGATALYGSVDINDATISCINHISFHGTETATRATYGGAFLNMSRCSFEGYDVAVDATDYSATITEGNVFVNNEIAVRLDVEDSKGGMNMNPWTYNTFINNETAVQMRSFNDFISPYYFRVVHSNFINNKTDFDLQAPVTVYMYRNYYGQYLPQQGIRPTPGKYAADRNNGREDLHLAELLAATTETKLNKIISSYAARIQTGSGAKVVSNPRWKYPVLDWWQRSNITIEDSIFGVSPARLLALAPAAEDEEATYENVLISDWELETAILNEEAENLQLSAEAFDAEGEKEIEVLDQDETVLGTWIFD